MQTDLNASDLTTKEFVSQAATFTMQAMRGSAAGTQVANYNTIRIIPLRFEL